MTIAFVFHLDLSLKRASFNIFNQNFQVPLSHEVPSGGTRMAYGRLLHVFGVRSTFLTDGFASCSGWLDPPSSGSPVGSCIRGRDTPESRSFCGCGRQGGNALFACAEYEPPIVFLECCVDAPLHVLFESSEAHSCNAALMHWTSVALPMCCIDGDE